MRALKKENAQKYHGRRRQAKAERPFPVALPKWRGGTLRDGVVLGAIHRPPVRSCTAVKVVPLEDHGIARLAIPADEFTRR